VRMHPPRSDNPCGMSSRAVFMVCHRSAPCGADRHKIGPYTAGVLRHWRWCFEAYETGRVLSAEGTEDKLRALRLLTVFCLGHSLVLPARCGAGTSAPRGLCRRPAPGGPLRARPEETGTFRSQAAELQRHWALCPPLLTITIEVTGGRREGTRIAESGTGYITLKAGGRLRRPVAASRKVAA
jgi:hypothetical protein